MAEIAPIEVNCNNFVIYRNKAAKFSTVIDTEDAHILCKFCKNLARDPPLRGNYIGKIRIFFSFGGRKPPPLNRSRSNLAGRSGPTVPSSLPNMTLIGATCHPCGAKKTQNRPVSKRNTGRAALRADPAGKKINSRNL